MSYYFVYGSNLDLEGTLIKRCPSARYITKAKLVGYRLGFAGDSTTRGCGVATVIQDDYSEVEGVLYELSDDDWEALDYFEGCPYFYKRRDVLVTTKDDGGCLAVTYVLDSYPNLPNADYLRPIVKGYNEFGLDINSLSKALIRQNYIGDSVFVYGTLKRGLGNHRLIENSVIDVIPATIRGVLYDLPYGYPVVLESEKGIVQGELCTFFNLEEVLRLIDRLEGFNRRGWNGNLYERVITIATTESGEKVITWTYIGGERLTAEADIIGKKIDSGLWIKNNN